MDKKEAINRLDDARDLIVEAHYMIEEILPHVDILGIQNMQILDPVTDIIKILSQLVINLKVNLNVPIEGMYKTLYHDYKKVCDEKRKLQKDIVDLMSEREWDKDTATLNIKLMRAERKIESLTKRRDAQKEKIAELKSQRAALKHKLKDLGYAIKGIEDDTDEESEEENDM